MRATNFQLLILLNSLISIFILSSGYSNSFSPEKFLSCYSSLLPPSSNSDPVSSGIIITRNSSAFSSVLQSSIRNRRFSEDASLQKPEIIVAAYEASHVRAAVICAKENELLTRVRSGGHDYEGLSYRSGEFSPFMVIDLAKFRSVRVDIEKEVAYVEAGATMGELYYKIAAKSRVHAFPAGSCPTVGAGGHFSGGGFGTIFRKYGLAADNILDATLVNSNGDILTRKSMGEDLFWAIRGGGASSFGVVLSWNVRLVRISPTVAVCNVKKTAEEGATKIFHKWQTVGNHILEDLFLHIVTSVTTGNRVEKTLKFSLTSFYLGPAEELVSLMDANFPELSLHISNCTEMSWIQSVLRFAGFSVNAPLEVLLNRNGSSGFFKAKSDFVTQAIPETDLEDIFARLTENKNMYVIWTPYGGKMSEISSSEIAFPHRSGNLYAIQYMASWISDDKTANNIEKMRRVYSYMKPYVSKSPRAAYLNYRDLDIGENDFRNTSYSKASGYGFKYFKHNFERLVRVKTIVDPLNFFRDEQSIPVQVAI